MAVRLRRRTLHKQEKQTQEQRLKPMLQAVKRGPYYTAQLLDGEGNDQESEMGNT